MLTSKVGRREGGRLSFCGHSHVARDVYLPGWLRSAPACLHACSSAARLGIGKRLSPSCGFVFQHYVGYSGCFVSLHKLQNQFVRIHKTARWGFDWNCIESLV